MTKRNQLLNDLTETYIFNFPDEFNEVKKINTQKKATLADDKLGRIKMGKKLDGDIRHGFKLPSRLYNSINKAIKIYLGDKEPAFGNNKGDFKFYSKKFPEFFIPNRY